MILAIVQARMASTRLPGKVMKEILGRPLIWYLIQRLKLSKRIDHFIVATSLDASNDELVSYLRSIDVPVYRGSEDDVLDRFYQASLPIKPDTIVRITADCPLLDPQIVDRVIEGYRSAGCSYAATASDKPGFPDGLDVEVFSFADLKKAWTYAKLGSEREHVTPYIAEISPKQNFYLRPDQDHSQERWTVDEPHDLELVKNIIEALYPKKGVTFTMADVLDMKRSHQELFDINRSFKRNEGYEKSLKQDVRMGLVSIVMAVCNGEKYLSEQLKSLTEQTYPDIEIVIVDDASTDASVRIAQEVAAKDARVRVHVNEKRLGIVANFMKGVHLASGQYVALCDQDDIWRHDKVQVLKGYLDMDPRCMMAYSDLEVCDESMRKLDDSFMRSRKIAARQGRLGEYSLLKNIAPGCAMLFRRQVRDILSTMWQDEVFMDKNRAGVLDDTPVLHDHLVQIVSAGLGGIVFCPQRLVRYRQHGANNIGASYKARRGRDLFIASLSRRLDLLESYKDRLAEIRWESVKRFLSEYSSNDRGPMPWALSHFTWLRNETLGDRLLAWLDCYCPWVYNRLRGSRA